ncbi:hypothetical protein GGI11_006082 [Coemansia sp. RSA 2049]|nr:hypothetical protein GGI11_006082 [Coemansia sp. RSA 2049]
MSSASSMNPFSVLSLDATSSAVPETSGSAKKPKPKPAKAAKPAGPEVPTTTVSTGRGGSRRTFVPGNADAAPQRERGERSGPRTQRQRGPPPRANGRQFDRPSHSGTGITDSVNKVKREEFGDNEKVIAEGEMAAEAAKKDSEEGAITPVPAAAEEEEDVKTFDDFLKEKGSSKTVDTTRARRKANDGGVDKSQLKNGTVLERVEEDFFAPTAGPKSRKQKERKEKIFVEINQHFVKEQRRGAFRSAPNNGPRNNDRRSRNNTQRVNINDERDFPSL